MLKMAYIDYNELLKNSRHRFFWIELELKKVFHCLEGYDIDLSLKSKKVGIYQYLKKLIPCFDVLLDVSNSNSIQSMISLERMIVDNYSIFFLLTTFSTKEEQLLRYYLYLLDATTNRSKIIKQFPLNSQNNTSEFTFLETNSALNSDNIASIEIKKLIMEENLNSLVSEEVISNSNWKFIDPKSTKKNQRCNQYKWETLYTIAKIPEHHAKILQAYHSAFVHGLGISLMLREEDNVFPHLISTIDFISILQSLIIKILLIEFKEETNDVKLNQLTIDFVNNSWNNWL